LLKKYCGRGRSQEERFYFLQKKLENIDAVAQLNLQYYIKIGVAEI